MNNLERFSRIRREQLSEAQYFQSLLQAALQAEELSQQQVETIQLNCFELLAQRVERFTQGDSSSVPEQTARSILSSCLFTIGLHLKHLPSPADALDALETAPVAQLYAQGRLRAQAELEEAKQLLQLVQDTKLDTRNLAYQDTLTAGLSPFFQKYDPDYSAHECPCSIDYPLMHPADGFTGVEFMAQYLKNLHRENRFLRCFPPEVLDEVLRSYDQGYPDLLINLYQLILPVALGCMLLGIEPTTLNIPQEGLARLEHSLRDQSPEQLAQQLAEPATALLNTLGLLEEEDHAYLLASLPHCAQSILHALQEGNPQAIFLPRTPPPPPPALHFSMGKPMENKAYLKLVAEVLTCRHSSDRVKLVGRRIRSLADFETILRDGELTPQEQEALFPLLGDAELAALMVRHPWGQEPFWEPDAEELTLRRCLQRFVEALEPQRQALLHQICRQLEVTE